MTPKFGKINAFRISNEKNLAICGDIQGRIFTADIANLNPIEMHHAHWGTVSAIAVREDGYVATLSMDRTVCLWIHSNGHLELLHKYSLLEDKSAEMSAIKNPNPLRSESQALCFHPKDNTLATRNAYGDLLILQFKDNRLERQSCLQVHALNDLVSVQYSSDGESLLLGTVRGDIILLQNEKIQKVWKLEDYTVHWFEEIDPNIFLVAGDSRRIAKLNLELNTDELTFGEPFASDDFEHITHHKEANRILATSFDRNVYEICKDTLSAKRVVMSLPFKNRWIQFTNAAGTEALVQCRNGALYLVDIDTSVVLNTLKSTPDTIWTCVLSKNKDRLFLAGEMHKIYELQCKNREVSVVETYKLSTGAKHNYTKRIVLEENLSTRVILGGQIDGTMFIVEGEKQTILKVSSGGIRDVALSPCKAMAYYVDELGCAGKLIRSTQEIQVLYQSKKPLRSLALSPDGVILAIAERTGNVILYNTETDSVIHIEDKSRTAKRMKWLDNDCLIYNNSTFIFTLDRQTLKSTQLTNFGANTTEDFCWDPSERYLIYVGYNREVCLHDLKSGTLLDRTLDDSDYSKGIIWLGDSDFSSIYGPASFATFGRNASLNVYEVFEERIRFIKRLENVCNKH